MLLQSLHAVDVQLSAAYKNLESDLAITAPFLILNWMN